MEERPGLGSGSSSASPAGAPRGDPPSILLAPSSPDPAFTPSLSAASNSLSKRSRGLGSTTQNPCTECRIKHAKCNGQRPCSRCKPQKDVECAYETPVRRLKEDLRTEMEQLYQRKRSSDQVFTALVGSNVWEVVLQRLREGQSIKSISDWLGDSLPSGGGAIPSFGHPGESNLHAGSAPAPMATMSPDSVTMSPITAQQPRMQQDVDQHVDSTRQSRIGSWGDAMNVDQSSEGGSVYWGLDQALAPLAPTQMKASTWTNITTDVPLVQHMLALYFCWEYPTFASLSKEHFLKDFQDGTPRYCSPILVNTLLALGCHFSSKLSARANPNDPHTSGDHFFKESQRLFYLEENHQSLTTIQALGIMSIREASCGRDSESQYYASQSIRLAIEMGLHQIHDEGDKDQLAVQAATFWGAFALDHIWSLATGSLPLCSCFPHLPSKPAIIDDIEASPWIPYTDNDAPLQHSTEQPSNVQSICKYFYELSELVHQSLYVLHSPEKPLTSRDLLNIYTQHLDWYDRIPEVLRLGHNFTPAILFTYMYYHFAILLLFRPLINLKILGSTVMPRDVCSQAADAIQGLMRSYSQLYTLRRTPTFMPYFLLTSLTTQLAIGATFISTQKGLEGSSKASEQGPLRSIDLHVAQAIKQGVEDLKDMAPCHHFAEQAINVLQYMALKWNIDVDMSNGLTSPEYARMVRPYTTSLNFFAPSIREEDFIYPWGSSGASSTMTTSGTGPASGAIWQVAQAAGVMENPLFWPFSMQGQPMLSSGWELEDAGFERI